MAKLIFLQFFLGVLTIFTVTTQALELGRCPYVRPKTDFDITKAVGDWYEYANYRVPGQSLFKCNRQNYQQVQDGAVAIHRTLTSKVTGLQTVVVARAAVTGPGTVLVTSNSIAGIFGNSTVSVLDTDYANYAVLFRCEEIFGLGVVHNRYATILTRKQQPEDYYTNLAKNALANNGLSVRNLITAEQSDCANQ